MIHAIFASALLAAGSVKIPAVATGIIPSAPVEFLLVAPDSDRDYESVFIAEQGAAEIAKAFEAAGFPCGRPVSDRACRFWPAGYRVTISPDPWEFVVDKELESNRLPAIFTGGERDMTGAVVAATNMPEAIFALYSLGQSLILLDDALDQSVTYGRFVPRREIEKGTRVEFTVSWDGSSGTKPYILPLKPGCLKESLEAMHASATPFGLDVTPSFSPDLTVAEAATAANALAVLDSRAVRINGFMSGELFYRAYMPLEKWRDRGERLTQPLEVRLSDSSATFTVIDEDWNVEGLDPKLSPRNVSFDDAKKFKGDTCFVYTSPDMRLERIYELKRNLPASLRNWYIYAEQP